MIKVGGWESGVGGKGKSHGKLFNNILVPFRLGSLKNDSIFLCRGDLRRNAI